MIDPHVHCRGWNESHKETVAHALFVAGQAGVSAIFDMPNTSPPLISGELVKKRIEEAKRQNRKVFYGCYMGLTADPGQIKEAVRIHKEYFPSVVGFKMYAGHSVGSLALQTEEQQNLVYETLSELNYRGVLAVHCEKEKFMKPELWDPLHPESHSDARPPQAESESIKDQIEFAAEAGFGGTLHIAHISHPDSVALVNTERKKQSFAISCGVTPHHCLLSNDLMKNSKGLLYKVNPPLRTVNDAHTMIEYLRKGIIDVVETDHAPHTLQEKLNPPYMSGFPGLPFFPHFLNLLQQKGFSEQDITRCTHSRTCELFQFDVPNTSLQINYDLHREYEVDVYEPVRTKLHT